MGADVFISYSQQTIEPTVALATALVERGYAPTYDVDLLPGDVFGDVLMARIDAAKAVITIWSKPALTSKWVPAESLRALNQSKLICVRTADLEAGHIPLPFTNTHTPLYTEIDGIVAKLRQLGVRPTGVAESDLPEEDVLSRNAARDWRNHIKDCDSADEVEAFLEAYRTLPMYRLLAHKRLESLRARPSVAMAPAPLATPPPQLPKPGDVILRLDPGMHTAAIRRIAVTSDGRMLATGSNDKTVRLWTLPEGELIRTLRPPIAEGDEGKVYAVALDPAGQWVAAAGWMQIGGRHFVTVFDAINGTVKERLGPLPNAVLDLEVSADGRRLAVGLGSTGIRVWSLNDGIWGGLVEDCDYGGRVDGLAFAPDGRLAVTSWDGEVRLYGPDLRLLSKSPAPGGNRPYGIAFSPDGARLAVGFDDTTNINVLDAASLALLWAADVEGISGDDLGRVAWLGDGRLVASGRHHSGAKHPVFVWDDLGRGRRTAWSGQQKMLMDLTVLPTGGFAFGGRGPDFGIVSAWGERVLWRGPATADLRNKVHENFRISPDGKRVCFGLKPYSGDSVLFDLGARRLTASATAPPDLITAETKRLKIENWENHLEPTLDRLESSADASSVRLALEPHEMARSLAITPDGQSFVLGTEWSLRRFDHGGKQIWEKAVPGVVWGVNLAREGHLVLAAYDDGTIRWHRTKDGAELLALFIHVPSEERANAEKGWILFTPKGHYDCSPGADDLIGWHVNRGPDQAADFYPAETFASTFKRPDIIDAALDGI